MFEFILVDDSNPEQKKKNRSIAHSHVKRINRRTKRDQHVQRKEHQKEPVVVLVEEGIGNDDVEELWSGHARSMRASSVDSSTSHRSSFTGQGLLTGLDDTGGSISTLRSMSPTIDVGFSTVLAGCFGTQDPRTHEMLDHCRIMMFSTASQETRSNKA
jgi:hypothetical protein